MSSNDLKNKIAVVTGAASGIGAAISKAFAANGARLGLIDIDETAVKAAADVYMPVGGSVTELNEELLDAPELVNSDPYGAAWMIKIVLVVRRRNA